jgi:citrate/tricarballylate utilization protein
VVLVATMALNGSAVRSPGNRGDFYSVVPHGVMVTLFGGVGLFVLVALWVGVARCRRDIRASGASEAGRAGGAGGAGRALRDVLTLRHLHATGEDCVTAEEARAPWRRWFHQATFYGFALCFASTSVAALYHSLGWQAPYAYSSVPVVLGAVGGIGLLLGPAGLLLQRRRRDPALTDPAHERLDRSFIVLLFLTSLTGLLLLVLRHQAVMGVLLIVHLGIVLALFVTLPYGKFVHGFYRTAALLKYSREEAMDAPRSGDQ